MAARDCGLEDEPSLSEQGVDLAESGSTPLFVAIGDRVAGVIGVQDTLKTDSRAAVEQLQALGL